MKVVVIKYNAGNISSVINALQRIDVAATVTDDPALIYSADKVILPGVGAAGAAMSYLRERKLDKIILSLEQPVLGICLGMQLMCAYSEENDTRCLGIFDGNVMRFRGMEKVPHMGWNNVFDLRSPLFKGIKEQDYMYFVHSYYAALSAQTTSVTEYGGNYSSALQSNNYYGVQFHPEKSGAAGQQLLSNFMAL